MSLDESPIATSLLAAVVAGLIVFIAWRLALRRCSARVAARGYVGGVMLVGLGAVAMCWLSLDAGVGVTALTVIFLAVAWAVLSGLKALADGPPDIVARQRLQPERAAAHKVRYDYAQGLGYLLTVWGTAWWAMYLGLFAEASNGFSAMILVATLPLLCAIFTWPCLMVERWVTSHPPAPRTLGFAPTQPQPEDEGYTDLRTETADADTRPDAPQPPPDPALPPEPPKRLTERTVD